MKSAYPRLARRLLASAFLLGSACVSFSAYALDYKTVGAAPAVMYDASSEKGRRVFVAPRGMPLTMPFGRTCSGGGVKPLRFASSTQS